MESYNKIRRRDSDISRLCFSLHHLKTDNHYRVLSSPFRIPSETRFESRDIISHWISGLQLSTLLTHASAREISTEARYTSGRTENESGGPRRRADTAITRSGNRSARPRSIKAKAACVAVGLRVSGHSLRVTRLFDPFSRKGGKRVRSSSSRRPDLLSVSRRS